MKEDKDNDDESKTLESVDCKPFEGLYLPSSSECRRCHHKAQRICKMISEFNLRAITQEADNE